LLTNCRNRLSEICIHVSDSDGRAGAERYHRTTTTPVSMLIPLRQSPMAALSIDIQVVADHDLACVRASNFFQKGFFRIWDLP